MRVASAVTGDTAAPGRIYTQSWNTTLQPSHRGPAPNLFLMDHVKMLNIGIYSIYGY